MEVLYVHKEIIEFAEDKARVPVNDYEIEYAKQEKAAIYRTTKSEGGMQTRFYWASQAANKGDTEAVSLKTLTELQDPGGQTVIVTVDL